MVKRLINNSMYKNSLYLMLNAGIMAILGFVFWSLAANYYSPTEVGLASTLISAIGLVAGFSLLGFNISIIRYLPKSDKRKEIIWSSFWLVSIVSALLGLGTVLWLFRYYPDLVIYQGNLSYILLFVLFSVFCTVFNLIESIFIAYRKSKFVLFKNSFWSILKIISLIVFVGFGTYGIFMGWYYSLIISLVASLFFINLGFNFKINFNEIKKMFKYSGSNYLGTIFSIMPGFVLPLFITYYLGAEQTAYFYISWMIANLLFFIPNSVGKSFLSEGSYDLIKTDFKSALKFSYLINIAGVILALIMGKFILSFFGTSYVENCLSLLYILVISSLFYSYNILIVMYYNLHHKVGKVIFIYATIAIITFILSYLLIDWGLLGIGFSWIVANLVLNVILFWREK